MIKADGAFRTIGEISEEYGIAQHILRYWETRFSQLRPLQRAGNRRYYRPADVALVARIARLLNHEGYTIRGVQKVLAGQPATAAADHVETADQAPGASVPMAIAPASSDIRAELIRIRAMLAAALSG